MSRRLMPAGIVLAAMLAGSAPASATSLAVEPLVTQAAVGPGGSTTIAVSLASDADAPERVVISPLDWRTRIDGSIALEPLGTEGARSLTPFLAFPSYQFVLQAHERRKLTLILALPAAFNPAPASYWGGFLVKATPLDAPPSATGPAATVFVYNDVGKPHRHLALQALRATAGGGGVHLVARYFNDGVGYVRCALDIVVSQGEKQLRKEHVGLGAIFPGSARIVDRTLAGLTAGSYHIELDADYGGETIIVGETNVTVS